jgi:FAD/FMN-containing dehydrogenase
MTLIDDLAAIVGAEHIVTDAPTLRRLSADLSHEPFAVAMACVAPANADQVASVVRAATAAGAAVIARGAARSYTRSHTPVSTGSVLADLRRLDSVVVDAENLLVTVQPGCTWERLYLELEPYGLRTPFWGTLSGRRATIGGTLSQNGAFFGSAAHGTAAESVLGLAVVLADGRLLRTGAGAHPQGLAFSRHHGPDLTSLFLADSGALGVKVEATLALLPAPRVATAACFAFDRSEDAVQAMAAIGRLRLASDAFRFDGYYHDLLVKAGFRTFAHLPYSVHVLVEGYDEHDASTRLAAIRGAAGAAREIPADLGLAMIADPFGVTRQMFVHAPRQSHIPVHAYVPLSAALEAARRFDAYIASETGPRRAGLSCWTMALLCGRGILIECSLMVPAWPDDDGRWPEVRAIRRELATVADDQGALHFQLGKYYDYQHLLEEPARDALRAVKRALDPNNGFNPGALGL